MNLVVLELDTHHCHLDIRLLNENNNRYHIDIHPLAI